MIVFSVTQFQSIFEPFGRDLPVSTLLLMDTYKYWMLVPALSLAFLAYAHLRQSTFAYRVLRALLVTAVFFIPLACLGIYAPVVSGFG